MFPTFFYWFAVSVTKIEMIVDCLKKWCSQGQWVVEESHHLGGGISISVAIFVEYFTQSLISQYSISAVIGKSVFSATYCSVRIIAYINSDMKYWLGLPGQSCHMLIMLCYTLFWLPCYALQVVHGVASCTKYFFCFVVSVLSQHPVYLRWFTWHSCFWILK
jgi:hypothetical protein